MDEFCEFANDYDLIDILIADADLLGQTPRIDHPLADLTDF